MVGGLSLDHHISLPIFSFFLDAPWWLLEGSRVDRKEVHNINIEHDCDIGTRVEMKAVEQSRGLLLLKISSSLARPSADDLLSLPREAIPVFFDGDDGLLIVCA